MANVYIEPRPKGRDGDPISHYVVEDHADSELHRAETQQEAIDWATQRGHSPLVARVRHLSDKRNPISGVRPNDGRMARGLGHW